MKKLAKKAVALSMVAAMATPAFQLSGVGSIDANAAEKIDRVMVHDPSIFEYNNEYYVFGSHIATAKSSDLVNWTQVSTDYQSVGNNPIYGNVKENLAESFKWAGYDDGDCKGGYAVWAPDVIYNPNYVWADGHKGAYMLYYSASSTWRRSCIGYMVSDRADGGYSYGGTVVYSGFTNTGKVNYDGNSTRDTTYTNDYLPFNKLIEEGKIDGDVSTWKCFNANGSWNNNYAPNAIDPTLFYDATGEHLYMVYGSWSGGLFILEIDQKTGAAIYPGKDGVDATSGNFVDRYFGTHIAGGNHQSGEGPYIEYDKNTGYYYMYETYGGLTTTGGYNMRLFRSKNPLGPYEDASGKNAAGSGKNCYQYGTKLIGNYQFYGQPGYRAAGHNSALITDDGKYYLIYHQRFLDSSRGEGHEVRVHQQFLNEDDWLVTAVYENRNEQIQKYTMDDVVGTYEYVNHGNGEKDGSMISTQSVELNADGTVTGDVTGTWTMADATDRDYTYVTINADNATYKGVFFEQTNDNGEKTMTFTANGSNNLAIWGSKYEETDETAAGKVIEQLKDIIPESTRENIQLPTELGKAKIEWSSDNQAVLSADGKVGTPSSDTEVTLTGKVTVNSYSTDATFKVLVYDSPKVIVGYDFDSVDGDAVSATSASTKDSAATLKGDAKVVTDEERGQVLKLENEAGNKQVNYLSLPSDVFSNVDKAGYTVSMWVNIDSSTWEHSALFEADWLADGASTGTYPMTRIGANLIGRINANDYSDAVPGLSYSDLTNKWQLVTYTVALNGIKVYLNGNEIVYDKKDISNCFSGQGAAIQNANHVMVGAGDIWTDEDVRNAMFDDVRIYDTALTGSEIKDIYESTYKEKEEEPEEPEQPEQPEVVEKAIDEEEPEVEGQTKVYVKLDNTEFPSDTFVYAVDEEQKNLLGEYPGKRMAHIGNGWYSVNVPSTMLYDEKLNDTEESDVKEVLEESEEKIIDEDITESDDETNDADEIQDDTEAGDTVEEIEGIVTTLLKSIKSAFAPLQVSAAEHDIFNNGIVVRVNDGKDVDKIATALFTATRPSAEELKQGEADTPEVPDTPSEPSTPSKPSTPSTPGTSNNSGSTSGSSNSSSGAAIAPAPAANTATIVDAAVPTVGAVTKTASTDAKKTTKSSTKVTKTATVEDEAEAEETEESEEAVEDNSAEETQETETQDLESQETETTITTIEDEETPEAVEETSVTANGVNPIAVVVIVIAIVAAVTGVVIVRKRG